MPRAFLVFVVALVASNATAAERTPFTSEDVARWEQITDFKISPTGDEAVYVRHWCDVRSPRPRTALWRIDGKTGRREPLSSGAPDGRMPVFSPDGTWLTFLTDEWAGPGSVPSYSDRPGELWMLSRRRSSQRDARPFKASGMERLIADGFHGRVAFSRDGRRLLYVADGNAPRLIAGRPIDTEDQGEGYAGYSPQGIWVLQLDEEGRPVPHSKAEPIFIADTDDYWYGDPQFTPDGKSIVCHANRTDDQESVRYSINKNYDLCLFELQEHKPKHVYLPIVLTDNPGPDVSPRISPDGKHVLYLSVPRKGPHMDVFNLCVLPLTGDDRKPQILVNAHAAEREADGTPPFQPTFPLREDCWIDSEHVRVSGIRGMKTETVVLNIAGPHALVSTEAKPEPVPNANPHFKKPEANPWLEERLHGPQEIVRWKSFDELEMEGVLTLPPPELTQFQKPYAVIVHPHGGPHSTNSPGFNLNVQIMASAGYAVFQPNYRGSYGYGRRFLDAARFDMGGSDMQDILTGVDFLIERGIVDAKRQYIYGSSYGGYSTCRLVTLTNRFKAAVAQNAVTDLHAMWRLSDLQSWTEWEFGGKPWETVERDGRKIDIAAEMRDRSPTAHAHRVKTPTLLLHADHDRRCPLAMGQMFHRLLKENGCETGLIAFTDERHQIQQVHNQARVIYSVLDWFAKHVD